jgi:hypothetical protein
MLRVFFENNAAKITRDAISYARIQAQNIYFKEVLGRSILGKRESSSTYLTEQQYRQVITTDKL